MRNATSFVLPEKVPTFHLPGCQQGRRHRRLPFNAIRRRRGIALWCAAAGMAMVSAAHAVPRNYVGANGSFWSGAGNWSPAGVPVNGDVVTIGSGLTPGFTLNFDSIYSGTGLTSMVLDPFSSGNLTLIQSTPASVLIADQEIIGNVADGSFFGIYNQISGLNKVGTSLTVGSGSGGNGIYNLSGGTVNVGYTMFLGSNAGSTGQFNLSSSGYLTENRAIVGNLGNGTFNQSGGNHVVSGSLYVAFNPNSTGVYNFSGDGVLTAATAIIGDDNGAVGTFNQSSGTFYDTGNLSLASFSSNSRGTYAMSNGGTLNLSGNLIVGDAGRGLFNQTGGTTGMLPSKSVFVGNLVGSSGTVNLSGGTLNLPGTEYIGYSGQGTFNLSSGSHTTGALYLGYNAGGSGTYSLTNGASLTVTSEYIGYNGGGTFNQTGGTHSVGSGNALTVAFGPSSSGMYNLSGGRLSTYNTIIGNTNGAVGVFNQSGGTHSIGGDLTLATGSINSLGSYAISNGATLTVGRTLLVGDTGSATFTQTGGVTTVNGANGFYGLYVGSNAGASGTISVSGGSLSVTAGDLFVGRGGLGTYAQSGNSTVRVSLGTAEPGGLIVGVNGGTGTATLSGGSLIADGNETIGFSTTGSFTQTGGTNSVGLSLYVGSNFNGRGSYALTNGTLAISGDLQVGYQTGMGTFTQTGGAVSVGGNAIFGTSSTGAGILNLGGGTFQVAGSTSLPANGTVSISAGQFLMPGGTLAIGTDTRGSYIQSGGTVQIGSFTAGNGAGTGNATLSGGFFNVDFFQLGGGINGYGSFTQTGGAATVTADTYIGVQGTGVFTQTGGSHTINGTNGLFIGHQAPAKGFVTLEGGTFAVKRSTYIGYAGEGTVTLSRSSSAVVDFQDDVHIGYQPLSKGFLNPEGGSVAVKGHLFVGNNGAAKMIMSASSIAQVTLYKDLYVGHQPPSKGLITVDGGNVKVIGKTYIGNGGEGTMTLSRDSTGFVDFEDDTHVGYQPASKGFLNLEGGTVAVKGHLFVGNSGAAKMIMSPSSIARVTLSKDLYIGHQSPSKALVNFDGGNVTVIGKTYIGNGGEGTVTLSRRSVGLVDFQDDTHVGYQPASKGFLNLDGGTVAVKGHLFVGNSGQGKVILSASSVAGVTLYKNVYVGHQSSGKGFVTIDGGAVAVKGIMYVGNDGEGTYSQSGGSMIAHKMILGSGSGTGVASVSGGTFDADTIVLGGTNGGSGAMRVSGIAQVVVHKGFRMNDLTVDGGSLAVLNEAPPPDEDPILNASIVGGYQRDGALYVNGGTVTTPNIKLGLTPGFTGSFTQSAGTVITGTLTLGTGGTGIVSITGGLLTAVSTLNNGSFAQTGGISSLGAVSGTGSMTVGGGTGNTQATLDNFSQNSVTINTGGTLTVAPAPVRYTNAVKTLTINGNGLLDLQNHHLLVDNTATTFAKVKQYVDAAYNRNPGTGIGDYNGRGGITSSVAKMNVDFMGVGYYNGALQNPANPDYVGQVLGPNANSGAGTGIPQTQILVRPTLTGDLNGDGVVNSYDVNLFNTFGLFNQPTNLGYQAGDLNGDGVVNAKDVTIFNSAGNFNNGSFLVAKAASTLAGHSAPPAAAVLNPGAGAIAFQYDPVTGNVKVNYNGFTGFPGKPTFNTTNHALSLIDILSTNPAAFPLDSSKVTWAALTALSSSTFVGNTEINLTAVNGYLPDYTDIGRILPPGLNTSQFAGSLIFSFNYTGSRQLAGGLAAPFPEPAMLSLLGFGALGLLSRRRRQIQKNAPLV